MARLARRTGLALALAATSAATSFAQELPASQLEAARRQQPAQPRNDPVGDLIRQEGVGQQDPQPQRAAQPDVKRETPPRRPAKTAPARRETATRSAPPTRKPSKTPPPRATAKQDAPAERPVFEKPLSPPQPPAPEPPRVELVTVEIGLPDVFNGETLPEHSLALRSLRQDGASEACKLVDYSQLTAAATFECMSAATDTYSISLRGFQAGRLGRDPAADSLRFDWPADQMLSTRMIRLLPSNPAFELGGEAAKALPVGQAWPALVSGASQTYVEAHFGALSPGGEGAARYCKLREPDRVPLAALMSEETQPLDVTLSCDFVLLDFAALPDPQSRFLPRECLAEAGGPICVLDEPATGEDGPAVTVSPGRPWKPTTIALRDGNRIADYLTIAADGPFADGRVAIPVGDKAIEYRLTSVTAMGGERECRTVWKADDAGSGNLQSFAMSRFNCDDDGIRPEAFILNLKLSDTGGVEAPGLYREVNYAVSLAGNAEAVAPTFAQVIRSATLRIDAPGRELPEFYSLRIYENDETCMSGASPMFETGMSSKSQRVEIGKAILPFIQQARGRLFDGRKPLSSCGGIELASASGEAAQDALFTYQALLLRPDGKTGLLVLSPSNALGRAGWRGPIQAAIRDWVGALRAANTPAPVDMVEITENRRTQLVMAAEDFSWLPESGGSDSLAGRLDRIRYNAGISRPLEDINIVQRNFADVDFGRVLFIADSTNEVFDPRDMGSLYHWLLNRKIEFRLLSLGGCEGWLKWTENVADRVRCDPLPDDPAGDQHRRKQLISESLDWLLEGVEREMQ